MLCAAYSANPVVKVDNIMELLRMISQSENNYITYGSWSYQLRHKNFTCDIQGLEFPSIGDYFRRSSYILRRGIPREVYARLDVALMTLRDLADRVGGGPVLFLIEPRVLERDYRKKSSNMKLQSDSMISFRMGSFRTESKM